MPRRHTKPSARAVETVSTLLGRWPSVAEFARDIGVSPNHAQTMRIRGSIPVDYWPALIAASAERHIGGVTAEYLMKLHARQRPVRRSPAAAATKARLVKSRRGQAVQLPKEFQFRGQEVEISRRGQEVVLRQGTRGLERAFEIIANLPIEDLADERDAPPQEREGL